MEKCFGLFSILSIFIIIDVNGVAIENSNNTVSEQSDSQCSGYCHNLVKPLLERVSSALLKEKQFPEMQAKLHEQELIIKSIESLQETIKSKDIQMGVKIALIDSYQTQLSMKNENITEKDGKILNLTSLIKEKDVEISNLKAQAKPKIKELKSKLSYLEEISKSSSCIGKSNDVHTIEVPGGGPFSAPCDSDLAGCGWTVIQRREDGSENFYRTWEEYKVGFGNLRGEFFLGLEKIYLMTQSQPHELYIYLEDFQNETRYAKYSDFLIGNEAESYEIKMLGDYSGDAEDAMIYHLNMKFSTHDRDNDDNDNDNDNEGNCAIVFESGWWFNSCFNCNLNGRYVLNTEGKTDHITWNEWHLEPLKFAQMMIRPTSG